MTGDMHNFLTLDAFLAHKGAALALFRLCELLERRLQRLLNARLRRLYFHFAVLLLYESAERQFGNNRVDFLPNIVDERRALFSAYATPLCTHIAHLYIPSFAYNQYIQAKSKRRKKRTLLDDFDRRHLVRVRFVGRQIKADESDVDAAAFELLGELRIARQRL